MQTRDPQRKIFLIATEESGDRLGSALMKVLRQRLGDGVQFVGVGGRTMAREGLETLFPIEELSIVGFAAVIQQLPKILRLIRGTVDAVLEAAPDALVIIDSPDFTHRVARRVRAKNPRSPSSTMSRRSSGPGGRDGRGPCSAMSITCSACCPSSRRNTASSAGRPAAMSATPDRAIVLAAAECAGAGAPRR